MSVRRDPLPALTPLRFPAALGVFLAHACMVLRGDDGPLFPIWLNHVAIGVQFFFVLSGFILTYNYLDELRHPTRRAVWNFYVARWARTYPVHLLTCALLLPLTYRYLVAHAFGRPTTVVAVHVFLGQAFLPEESPKGNALNPPSWSLSAEWFFYLLLPLLIPALTSGSLRRRCAVVLVALTPWAVAVAGAAGVFALPTWFSPYRYPPVRLVDFVTGVLLGIAWHRRHGSTVPATKSFARATLVEIGALFLLAAWVLAYIRATPEVSASVAARWSGVYLPPLALLVWVLARGAGLVSRVLMSGPLTYLGEISYAFYMFHWGVLYYLVVYGPTLGLSALPWGARWAVAGVAALVLAVACYHLYEIPLRDRLRRLLSIRRSAPVVIEGRNEEPTVSHVPVSVPGADKRAA
jgi:peptidoglycan/LPS O-acetylase OafA/YrhL